MAERGGYRRPSESQSYSGVGKNSRRTDKQPVRSPNVQDSTDLQVGDREHIRQGQKIVPLSETPSPSVSAPPRGGPAPAAGAGAGELPPHVFGLETTRPGEPVTEGAPFGPGSGPEVLTPPEPQDDMDIVLQAMVELTGDRSIAQMLTDHREFKSWRSERQAPMSRPPEALPAQGDLGAEEVMAGEEEETLRRDTRRPLGHRGG